MTDIEVRRIQRVGSSSLVVTLPKEWARRLGLKQGSTVVLYEEGDSIRIVPAEKREIPSVYIDLSRMPPILAMSVPVCSYLSGIDRVEFTLPEGVPLEAIKMRALTFMGMHVYEKSPRRLVVETLLDMDKIDPDSFIKTLGAISSRLISGLVNAIANGGDSGALKRADFARHDFMRTLYVVLRSLFTKTPIHESRRDLTLKLMSASYISLAIETIYTMLPLISHGPELAAKDRRLILEALQRLGEGINLLLHIIPSPSVKRLDDLLRLLNETERRVVSSIRDAETPLAGAMLAKIHDALRILTLASYITVCRILGGLAESAEG